MSRFFEQGPPLFPADKQKPFNVEKNRIQIPPIYEEFDDLDYYEEEPYAIEPRTPEDTAALLQSIAELEEIIRSLKSAEGKESGRFEFFLGESEQRELFEYCRAIAEYIHEKQIPNLVIVDRSSRPLYIGVKEYLKTKYPETKLPGIYFVNPKGFKSREDMTLEEVALTNLDAVYKGDRLEPSDTVRFEAEIMKDFEQSYPKLFEDRDKPVLVFDSCLHTGNTLLPVKQAFERAGFHQTLIGSVNANDPGSSVKTDFFITHRRPAKGCYPFDRDRMIEKTFSSVYATHTPDKEMRRRSNRLRAEIRKIIDAYLKDPNNLKKPLPALRFDIDFAKYAKDFETRNS